MDNYIIIIDFYDCITYIHKLTDEEKEYKDAEELIESLGLDIDSCNYMVTDDICIKTI